MIKAFVIFQNFPTKNRNRIPPKYLNTFPAFLMKKEIQLVLPVANSSHQTVNVERYTREWQTRTNIYKIYKEEELSKKTELGRKTARKEINWRDKELKRKKNLLISEENLSRKKKLDQDKEMKRYYHF